MYCLVKYLVLTGTGDHTITGLAGRTPRPQSLSSTHTALQPVSRYPPWQPPSPSWRLQYQPLATSSMSMVILYLKNKMSQISPRPRGFPSLPSGSPPSYFVSNDSRRIPNSVIAGVHNFLAASKVATLRGLWEAMSGSGEVVVGGHGAGRRSNN